MQVEGQGWRFIQPCRGEPPGSFVVHRVAHACHVATMSPSTSRRRASGFRRCKRILAYHGHSASALPLRGWARHNPFRLTKLIRMSDSHRPSSSCSTTATPRCDEPTSRPCLPILLAGTCRNGDDVPAPDMACIKAPMPRAGTQQKALPKRNKYGSTGSISTVSSSGHSAQ
jgi:hypothetical protein